MVHVAFGRGRDADEYAEFIELARSAGLDIAASVSATRQAPEPNFLVGRGKADEIASEAGASRADVIIFNHALTPAQERNLELHTRRRVIDRIGLILDIFAQRALSHAGKLQVELAQLQHLSTRLIRGWTHLERQKGGIGLRGPGETQLETDRRLIGQRIKVINQRLQKVRQQRRQGRRQRKKNDLPVISLVGYTNAGKSTLFNRLTGARLMAEDMLFATLDPTLRRVSLPHGEEVILSDTVGFISELPTMLVAAFRATLEEVLEADVILHVRDIASDESQQQAEDVAKVLAELGIQPGDDRRVVEVWNKIDCLAPAEREALTLRIVTHEPPAVLVSATTGEGMADLLAAVEQSLMGSRPTMTVELGVNQLGAAPWLYENTEVLERSDDPETGAARLKVRVAERRLAPLRAWAEREHVVVAAA